MTDREKLIQDLLPITDNYLNTSEDKHFTPNTTIADVADLLIEKGWIRPPCNLNDEVYCIVFDYAKNELVIRSGWVLEIIIKHETLYLKIADRVPIKYSNFCITVDANEWKTIVFPTKEEAEEKLNNINKGVK